MGKRLIDADALKQKATPHYFDNYCYAVSVEDIDDAPTVDAVEVVRCKECVSYCGFENCKNGICDVDVVSKRAVNPDDFCSYGERRTDGKID